MYSKIHSPEHRLSKDAVKIWIIREVMIDILGFIILGVLFYLDYHFSWKDWIGWILIVITIIAVLFSIWSIFIEPFLLYRNFRYDADESFLQLKSGALKEVHQLVPMTKIQAVETNQGPLFRKYGLCSLEISTMGSSHTIPALPKEVAVKWRNQIAHFAKIKEVEE
ncbi:PH domain-containing protein [Virgibacillus alimentarius]|uniref:Membrane protein YdbS with pleckstrin-like domain n=1 Tax=Virgibacillus alimentarius TaxID=698769 RepID=A0ABS4S9J9_9BACI|nr:MULTISPECIES: PH domain-containing protein [Virgibacillus]MBP2258178.1 membrane protein YdbS with pleckstrin-like domain [Virgibacillus alimentarius]HLR66535.1 PH domain-containing protein [Virgibacillus sp.]